MEWSVAAWVVVGLLAATRPGALGGLLLRFPATVLLLALLTVWDLAATNVLSSGPALRVVLIPILLLSYLVDPVGALASRLGFPYPGAVEVGTMILGMLLIDWAMKRATQ